MKEPRNPNNQQRFEAAQQRILAALAQLREQQQLPEPITARAQRSGRAKRRYCLSGRGRLLSLIVSRRRYGDEADF